MNRENLKTIAIMLLSVILVAHSVEKNSVIDELNDEISFLNFKVSVADSLIRDTTINGLIMADKLLGYQERIKDIEANTHKIVVTMYHPVPSQTDDTPNITADGTVIKIKRASEYNYVAVSRNMLVRNGGFLRFGDYVWVDAGKKSGVYQVKDTMNARFTNRIDILETPGVKPYKYDDASLRRIKYDIEQL
tara:strand:- start:462 stop:1034 length:573 start_codon:yes stop_codon:yes gene_type:complete